MTYRNVLIAVGLFALLLGGVLYWFVPAIHPLAPPAVVGPLTFYVIEVSNKKVLSYNSVNHAEQIWITVEVDPSNPRVPVGGLRVYLPRLFQETALIGPDGSRQKFFSAHEGEMRTWYDKLRKNGTISYLRMELGFDNKKHWKTAILSTHFLGAYNMWDTNTDALAVAGKTLLLGPIRLR